MTFRAWMLLLMALIPLHAQGQLGASPPTESVEQVAEEASEEATEVSTVVPGLAGNVAASLDNKGELQADVKDEGQVSSRDLATGVRPGTLRVGGPQSTTRGEDEKRAQERRGIAPPPAVISAENGQAVVFSIAVAHLNRIVTPFDKPAVKTTSTASIATDRGILYVSTSLDEPVSMFVHDANDPSQALSLTMVPAEIPPVSTTVELKGYARKQTVISETSKAHAEVYETAHPYPQMVTALMRDLALGKIPDGYGFEALSGPHPAMPACSFGPGIWVEEKQMATGASLLVFVAKVTNRAGVAVELYEEACAQERVRAVATWPKRVIGPGESTELFVAVDAGYEVESGLRRPSTLGGAR